MRDLQGREISYLRVSVTDRCNLRCVYCMPEQGVPPMAHADLLTYEEILRVCRLGAGLGISKIRLTGGEPLVRPGLAGLAARLKATEGIEEVTLTSNGVLLYDALPELARAGVDGVNISLDTLDAARFEAITRRQGLEPVLRAIDRALDLGLRVKLNCVAVRELGGEDFAELAAFARERPIDVRFIELMPIGCGREYTPIPNSEVRAGLERRWGAMIPCARAGNGPAVYYHPAGFLGAVGLISAMSDCFCGACNRVRLTSSGFLKLCLHHGAGVDLRAPLRGGSTDEALTALLYEAIAHKPARQSFGGEIVDEDRRVMSQIGG